jgi:hypothetical protein
VSNSNPVQDGSATTLSQFQADPDGLRTVLAPMDIPESSRRLMISIQVGRDGWEGVRAGLVCVLFDAVRQVVGGGA